MTLDVSGTTEHTDVPCASPLNSTKHLGALSNTHYFDLSFLKRHPLLTLQQCSTATLTPVMFAPDICLNKKTAIEYDS